MVLKQGMLIGSTPCTVRLPAGPATIDFILDGYRTRSETVVAREGENFRFSLEKEGRRRHNSW
jgi:hypothetical protein